MSEIVYILKKEVPFLVRLTDDGNPFTSQYKIGKTKRSVTNRLSHARTGSSYPVVVHAEYRVRNCDTAESLLHDLFSHKQIQDGSRNEWYHLSHLDLMIIECMMIFL